MHCSMPAARSNHSALVCGDKHDMKNGWFQRYLLPGFIFQSAIIAGAYGSGREIAEFFLGQGPLGGLLGMAVTTTIFSIVLVATFEFSRHFRLYDYRSFFKALLGRGWPVYEILYWLLMILVLSIVGAAAGDIVRDTFGLPPFVGIIGIMSLIALLVFFGSAALERFFTAWSFVLYGTYILLLGWHLVQHGDQIQANLTAFGINEGWLQNGIAYSGYNLATVPALLFCIRHLGSRRDAVIAGIAAGPIAMLPAAFFFIAMIGQYESLLAAGRDSVLPVTILLNSLSGAGFLIYLFPIVLFGTFIETGAALIHGVNERLDQAFAERSVQMPRWMRPAVALAILFLAVVMADAIGLTSLVAQGYGSITWGFLLIYLLPILTYGVWLLGRRSPAH
jgi:uncharacterized membrane protein YkvI